MERFSPVDFFEELYEEHHRGLHAFFYGRTNNRAHTLDLLQITFMRVWQYIYKLFKLSIELRAKWIYTVARNLVTDHYRSSANRLGAFYNDDSLQNALPASESAMDDKLSKKEQLGLLNQAISELPEELRMILSLSLLGEMNSVEIGEHLEMPPGTVRYKLSQARQMLAQRLQLVSDEMACEVVYNEPT